MTLTLTLVSNRDPILAYQVVGGRFILSEKILLKSGAISVNGVNLAASADGFGCPGFVMKIKERTSSRAVVSFDADRLIVRAHLDFESCLARIFSPHLHPDGVTTGSMIAAVFGPKVAARMEQTHAGINARFGDRIMYCSRLLRWSLRSFEAMGYYTADGASLANTFVDLWDDVMSEKK